MQCNRCGTPHVPGATFCPGCGAPLRSAGVSPWLIVGGLLALLLVLALGYLIGRSNQLFSFNPLSPATKTAPDGYVKEPAPLTGPERAGKSPSPSPMVRKDPLPGSSDPAAALPSTAPPPAVAPAFLDRSVTMGEWRYYVIVGSSTQGSGDAARRAAVLSRCLGYQPATDFTYAFEGLAANVEFVHLGGYPTQGQAQQILAWARSCVPDAYIRRARFMAE